MCDFVKNNITVPYFSLTTIIDIHEYFTQSYQSIHIVKQFSYVVRYVIYHCTSCWNNCTNDAKVLRKI